MKRKAAKISNNENDQVNAKTVKQNFLKAAEQGNLQTIESILLSEQNNCLTPFSRVKALHLATKSGHQKIVQLLI